MSNAFLARVRAAFSTTMSRFRIRIFCLTWVAYAGFYLCRKNFSVCMPLLKEDLGYTTDDFAWILTLYLAMYAVGQFINGYNNDRWGPRIIVGTGLLVSVGVNVGLGLASALSLFFLFYLVNGLAQSTGWSGTVKNMSGWFRKEERGIVMGFWCTCYVIGGFVATNYATFWATNEILFPGLGWRRGFFMPAATLFVIALLYILFTRNRPSDAGLPDFPEEDLEAEEAEAAEMSHSQTTWKNTLALMSHSTIWVAGIAYFFVKLTRYSFLFWLPFFMTEALGYEAHHAGYMSSVYELVGFLGVIAGGFLSDWFFQSRRFPVSALMLYGLGVLCLLYPQMSHAGFLWNGIGIGLIGMMTFGPDALMSGPAPMDIGGQQGAAVAAGMINGIGSLGSILSPIAVAQFSKRFGWDSLFYFFVVLAIISGTLAATKWNFGGNGARKAQAE